MAEDGFTVSPRLAGAVEKDQDRLAKFPLTAAYFLPDGMPIKVGSACGISYAKTLRAIAENGAKVFYTGAIAQAIVDTVQNAKGNPGRLAMLDFAAYRVVERPAVCAAYRGLGCSVGWGRLLQAH